MCEIVKEATHLSIFRNLILDTKRREGDSNPRYRYSIQQISNLPLSTTQPSLQKC